MTIDRRCTYTCERKPKGLRYVTARWRCHGKTLKGKNYCPRHEPTDERIKRRGK